MGTRPRRISSTRFPVITGEQKIRFAVLGPPVANHRPKAARSNRIDGRGVRMIKDKKDTAYQTLIAMECTSSLMRWRHENDATWVGSGEFHVDIEFHVQDLVKRDVDNLAKNVLDGLSKICFDDDRQVVSLSVTKHLNRKAPKTLVTIHRVEGFLVE